MTLTVFDLDKTLINGDSYDLWHEFLLEKGILKDDFIKDNQKMIELYDEGKLNMDEYLKFSITSLKSLSLDEISNLIPEFLETKIKPIIYNEAKIWIKTLTPNLIISATPSYIVNPVSKYLNVKEAIGVNLVVKNSHYTYEFIPPLSFQEGKVEALKIYLKNKNLNPQKIVFYTDSINDLAMCEFAHSTNCINPDDKLRKIALEKGWNIINLK